MSRPNRSNNSIRPVDFQLGFSQHPEGSCLVSCGQTKVLCNITIQDGVPRFLSGQQQGWLTAEYGMLPRSTHSRCDREANRGKQSGRTLEIQRLIGRVLRNTIHLNALKDTTIVIDCDVLQADGGTRTAAINGAMVALVDALRQMQYSKRLQTDPLRDMVAAISLGFVDGELLLDLDYQEDSRADADINVVMNQQGQLIELQASSEGAPIAMAKMNDVLTLAQSGINQIFAQMRDVLG